MKTIKTILLAPLAVIGLVALLSFYFTFRILTIPALWVSVPSIQQFWYSLRQWNNERDRKIHTKKVQD